MSRSSVVLPQPDGPSTVVNEPCGTWRVTSSTARVADGSGAEGLRDAGDRERAHAGTLSVRVAGLSERISSTVAGIETSTSSSA